jgi:hypothetical protein
MLFGAVFEAAGPFVSAARGLSPVIRETFICGLPIYFFLPSPKTSQVAPA